jgi:exonuclease VII small subunit
MKPISELTYAEAFDELRTIIESMQNDKCDIDRLAEMTKRASALIAECRNRLTATDEEIRKILAESAS